MSADPHLSYTKEMVAKNLIALEDHFKAYQCPICISKHLLALEEYAEEGIPMGSQQEAEIFSEVQQWAFKTRQAIQKGQAVDLLRLIKQARDLRQEIQPFAGQHTHRPGEEPGEEEAGCVGPQCETQAHFVGGQHNHA